MVEFLYLDVNRREFTEGFLAFYECEDAITGQANADYIVNKGQSLGCYLADPGPVTQKCF